MKKNKLAKVIGLLCSSLLVACGGGGGGSSDSSSDPAPQPTVGTITLTGMDGYYKNALVFIDGNNNGELDLDGKDKIMGLTDGKGQYPIPEDVAGIRSIQTLTPNGTVQQRLAAYDAKYVDIYTVDMDFAEQAVSNEIVFRAPASSKIISPVTDLVVMEMEKGSSESEAKSTIAAALGFDDDTDLYIDFIAQSATNDQHANLRKKAQILAASKAINSLDKYKSNAVDIAKKADTEVKRILNDEPEKLRDLSIIPVVDVDDSDISLVKNDKAIVNKSVLSNISSGINELVIINNEVLKPYLSIPMDDLFSDKDQSSDVEVSILNADNDGSITFGGIKVSVTAENKLSISSDGEPVTATEGFKVVLQAKDINADARVISNVYSVLNINVIGTNNPPVLNAERKTAVDQAISKWNLIANASFEQSISINDLISDPENRPMSYTTSTTVSGLISSVTNGVLKVSGTPTVIGQDGHVVVSASDGAVASEHTITLNLNLPRVEEDSDGDGYVNSRDAFPNNPAEWLDTDGDGTGNNADTDDDNDGVSDSIDANPLDNTIGVAPDKFAITSTPSLAATEDQAYSYQLQTNKGTPDTVNYQLLTAPAGMAISEAGLITWTPLEGVLSSGAFKVIAKLNQGAASVEQPITINVTPVNDVPEVAGISDQEIETGETLSLQLQVTDPDDSNFTYQVLEGPSGMAVSSSGNVSFSSSVTTSLLNQNVRIRVSDGEANTDVQFKLSEIVNVAIDGRLIDYFNNNPIANGKISLAYNGELVGTALSNAEGHYKVKVLDLHFKQYSDNLTLSVQAPSYSGTAIRFNPNEVNNNVLSRNLFMPKVTSTAVLDSQADGVVSENGVQFARFNANSFINKLGEAITGNITASILAIESMRYVDLLPGEIITTTSNNDSLPLSSYGALSLSFTDASGETVELADGESITIRIPVNASAINVPDTLIAYYFNILRGIWVSGGEARLIKDSANGDYYQANVSRVATWIAAKEITPVSYSSCVVDAGNNPISGVKVTAVGQDYSGKVSSMSDANGQFSLTLAANSQTLISANHNHKSRTKSVKMESGNKSDNSCLVIGDDYSKVTLKWGRNPVDLDTHFYGPNGSSRFHVYYQDKDHIQGDNKIFLDVDDVTSYGPEVLTIPKFEVPGVYQYAVKLFKGTGDIRSSGTTVELLLGDERTLFTPPENGTPKIWWHIFNLVVAEDLTVTKQVVNQWSSLEPKAPSAASSAYSKDTASESKAIDNMPSNQRQTLSNAVARKYYAD